MRNASYQGLGAGATMSSWNSWYPRERDLGLSGPQLQVGKHKVWSSGVNTASASSYGPPGKNRIKRNRIWASPGFFKHILSLQLLSPVPVTSSWMRFISAFSELPLRPPHSQRLLILPIDPHPALTAPFVQNDFCLTLLCPGKVPPSSLGLLCRGSSLASHSSSRYRSSPGPLGTN